MHGPQAGAAFEAEAEAPSARSSPRSSSASANPASTRVMPGVDRPVAQPVQGLHPEAEREIGRHSARDHGEQLAWRDRVHHDRRNRRP